MAYVNGKWAPENFAKVGMCACVCYGVEGRGDIAEQFCSEGTER